MQRYNINLLFIVYLFVDVSVAVCVCRCLSGCSCRRCRFWFCLYHCLVFIIYLSLLYLSLYSCGCSCRTLHAPFPQKDEITYALDSKWALKSMHCSGFSAKRSLHHVITYWIMCFFSNRSKRRAGLQANRSITDSQSQITLLKSVFGFKPLQTPCSANRFIGKPLHIHDAISDKTLPRSIFKQNNLFGQFISKLIKFDFWSLAQCFSVPFYMQISILGVIAL